MILEKEIQQMTNALKHFDKKDNAISKSGVDWHIDHNLRAIYIICKTLQGSEEKDYKPLFNFKRTLIFITKKFPRGKAKAPKAIVSKSIIIKEVIENRLKTTKILLKEIETLPKNSHFNHPIFGMLNLKQTTKFLQIHTTHHLKIIEDIISSHS
tara:strand:- start:154 stop:615 length:462 start_codon:yes stop_codon:yes gene_type:complete